MLRPRVRAAIAEKRRDIIDGLPSIGIASASCACAARGSQQHLCSVAIARVSRQLRVQTRRQCPRSTDDVYVSAVRKCATSLHAKSVTDAARWPASDLLVIARRFESQDPILLARAMLMHLEAARIVESDAARAQRSAAFALAMRLMALSGTSAPEGLRLNAVLATVAALHGSLDVVGVAALVTRGLATWPQEPHLLHRARVARRDRPGDARDQRTDAAAAPRGRAKAAAIRAVADYDAALLAAPDAGGGAHQARAAARPSGTHAAAIQDLEQAPPRPRIRRSRISPSSFSGRPTRTRAPCARRKRAYDAARAQIEDAQAPYLALAQLRTRQGQLSAAFTVTIAMTGRTRSTMTDPWWIYDYGQFWDLDRRMIAHFATWPRGDDFSFVHAGRRAAGATGRSHGQRPVFKGGVDRVRVDALVTDGERPVIGLTARDFSVWDNGVPQSPDLLESGGPVKVLLVLDISTSVAGERLEHLRSASGACSMR